MIDIIYEFGHRFPECPKCGHMDGRYSKWHTSASFLKNKMTPEGKFADVLKFICMNCGWKFYTFTKDYVPPPEREEREMKEKLPKKPKFPWSKKE